MQSQSLLLNYIPIVDEVPEVMHEEVIEGDDVTCSEIFVPTHDVVPEQSTSSLSSQSSYGPRRKKMRKNDTEPLLEKAQGILESVSSRLATNANKVSDSTNHDFGKYIASELSKIKSERLSVNTKQKIMSVLMSARIEELNEYE